MTIETFVRAGIGSLLLGLGVSAGAHHGQVGLFDETRMVEMTGTVKEWTFVNPHPVLILTVAAAGRAAEDWDVYFGPQAVSALRRRGFSATTFAVGETITVTGHPATAPGARGVDVWGAGAGVRRADGAAVP